MLKARHRVLLWLSILCALSPLELFFATKYQGWPLARFISLCLIVLLLTTLEPTLYLSLHILYSHLSTFPSSERTWVEGSLLYFLDIVPNKLTMVRRRKTPVTPCEH